MALSMGEDHHKKVETGGIQTVDIREKDWPFIFKMCLFLNLFLNNPYIF